VRCLRVIGEWFVRKGLGCLAGGLQFVASLGSFLLFTLIEWSYIVGNWLHFFNPFLHIRVIFTMLITPFFWLMVGLFFVGSLIEKAAGSAGEEIVQE
jgi:TRAP-type C4-dicarboxylate transport system permease small subunit